jgi:monoamine oxidase
MTLHESGSEPPSAIPDAWPAPAPVVVVGAGLSGLVAHLLEHSGLSVTLLEARDRVGGRVFGVAAEDGTHRFDLGPAWVWPELNPRTADWLNTLGLALFEQQDCGALWSSCRRRPCAGTPPALRSTPPRCAWSAAPLASQTPCGRSWCARRCCWAPRAGWSATGRHGQRRVRARRTGRDPGGVVGDPGIAPQAAGHRCIRWSPALPVELSQRWADAPTWMAGHAKLLARYATPFWRMAGLSGSAVSQAGPLAEVHDASDAEGRHAALFGFVGVPVAWRRRMGRQALIDASVAQLGQAVWRPGADATGGVLAGLGGRR